MIIERYKGVSMHIVSQVEGRLSTEHTPYDLIRATFPAGTLSGAPKIRAMQIISELEQTARGPTADVGYFSFNGNLDWLHYHSHSLDQGWHGPCPGRRRMGQ